MIKGTFKDHLVEWVEEYLVHTWGKLELMKYWMILTTGASRNLSLLSDLTLLLLSIAAAPSFAGLRCFPQGRGFKQWTGDDSKALMKVCVSLPSYEANLLSLGVPACH